MRGDTVLIRSGDSDAVARRLLNQTPARDLEITARGLEEAFIPLSQFSPDLQTFAKFTPLYGLSQLVHYPLIGGTLNWAWVLNLAVWLAIFVTGAAWCLRRDTARV